MLYFVGILNKAPLWRGREVYMKKAPFLVVLALSLYITPAFCSETSIQGFLVDIGKSFYQKGNYEEAVHEFSKALIVDPDNQAAKAYLK